MKSIVRFVTSQDPLFAQCFEMVCATFWDKYQREITHTPGGYLIYEHHGMLVSCVGISNGENGWLPSEQFLDEPVEQILTALTGEPVSRHQICEFSGLSTQGSMGGLKHLLGVTPLMVWGKGCHYAVITATRHLRVVLKKLGLSFQPIVSSSPARIPPHELVRWGNYLDSDPVTGWVDLRASALDFLNRREFQSANHLAWVVDDTRIL